MVDRQESSGGIQVWGHIDDKPFDREFKANVAIVGGAILMSVPDRIPGHHAAITYTPVESVMGCLHSEVYEFCVGPDQWHLHTESRHPNLLLAVEALLDWRPPVLTLEGGQVIDITLPKEIEG
jgi:hypothetical protein